MIEPFRVFFPHEEVEVLHVIRRLGSDPGPFPWQAGAYYSFRQAAAWPERDQCVSLPSAPLRLELEVRL